MSPNGKEGVETAIDNVAYNHSDISRRWSPKRESLPGQAGRTDVGDFTPLFDLVTYGRRGNNPKYTLAFAYTLVLTDTLALVNDSTSPADTTSNPKNGTPWCSAFIGHDFLLTLLALAGRACPSDLLRLEGGA